MFIHSDKELAATEVGAELITLCEVRQRMAEGIIDGTFYAACVDSTVLHARALVEFFKDKKKKPDDIVPSDFAAGWKEPTSEAFMRLNSFTPTIHKHVAHLTWERVKDKVPTDYHEKQMASDVHEVMGDWVSFTEKAAAVGAAQFRFAYNRCTTALQLADEAEWRSKRLDPNS